MPYRRPYRGDALNIASEKDLQNFIEAHAGELIKLPPVTLELSEPLCIPSGTTLEGSGKGDTVFGGGASKGTILKVTHDGPAIEIQGKMSQVKNLFIKGNNAPGQIGVYVNAVADGIRNGADLLLEGIVLESVYVHSLNTGFLLEEEKAGAITYSTFRDIRARDCQYGLRIIARSTPNEDGSITGFINSNIFDGVFISGGGFKKGLEIISEYDGEIVNGYEVWRPVNNLLFRGVVIEPPSSEEGHLVLRGKGVGVIMENIRVEASQQDSLYPSVPVIYLDPHTEDNRITLDQASITIIDEGSNNQIISRSLKFNKPSYYPGNLWKNPSLAGLALEEYSGNTIYRIPEWEMKEMFVDGVNDYDWRYIEPSSGVVVEYDDTLSLPLEGYRAIKVTLPNNHRFALSQHIDDKALNISNFTVNAWVKANAPKTVNFIYKAENSSIITLGTNLKVDELEEIGGHIKLTRDSSSTWYYYIQLFVQNHTGSDLTFWFAIPRASKGELLWDVPEPPITEKGGVIFGALGFNHTNVTTANNGEEGNPGYLVIPTHASIFKLTSITTAIQRINYTVNRFRRGSLITLICEEEGIEILDSLFISLKKDFKSFKGQTITLRTPDGTGTWEEISRSEPIMRGKKVVNLSEALSGGELIVNPFHNYETFSLNNDLGSSTSLIKINNTFAYRFEEGRIITLTGTADNTNEITLTKGAYLNLAADFRFKSDKEFITLLALGGGLWEELYRSTGNMRRATVGEETISLSSQVDSSTHELTIENLNATFIRITEGDAYISRINNLYQNRFPVGHEILLYNDTANAITIKNSGYIVIKSGGDAVLNQNGYIKLFTSGNGVWYEI